MRKIAASILFLSLFGLSASTIAADQQMKKMGVKMPQMQDGMMVHKVCISKEMASRGAPPAGHPQAQGGACTSKNMQKSGNTFSVDIVCDSPQMKGTGTSKGTFTGDSMSTTYDFKGTAHGQPVNQRHETTGKWLSADCGDVKPVDAMMPKK